MVQDGKNAGGKQNFKLYGWEDIAGSRLAVDADYPIRQDRPRATVVTKPE